MENTLHLNLKKKWFDMILSGEKKEEYREIKEYWVSGLTEFKKPFRDYKSTAHAFAFAKGFTGTRLRAMSYLMNEINVLNYKTFDSITFSNGFSKNRPQFKIEIKSISINYGKSIWGATPEVQYFVLELGEIISSFNGR